MDALITRTVGIELEVKTGSGNTHARTATALTRAGVETHEEGYNHTTRTHWKIVSDASLGRGGMEIVSPVLTAETIAQVDTVCETINARSTTVDRQCGFHLHVGIGDLSVKELAQLCKGLAKYERLAGHLCPESRRSGLYSNYNLENAVHERTHFARLDEVVKAHDRGNLQTEEAQRMICALAQPRGRYSFFNFQNYLASDRPDTVEVRVHSGTTDRGKIRNWARVWCLAVDSFKSTNFRAPTKTVKTESKKHGEAGQLTVDKEIRRFFKILQKSTAVDLKPMRKYYQGRAKSVGSVDMARTRPVA